MSGELWFYHLERTTLADALPELLEKTLQKGWRALVRAPSEARLDHIDTLLWTARDDSFLAHGRWDDGDPERQPILLSIPEGNANKADILFALDRRKRGSECACPVEESQGRGSFHRLLETVGRGALGEAGLACPANCTNC